MTVVGVLTPLNRVGFSDMVLSSQSDVSLRPIRATNVPQSKAVTNMTVQIKGAIFAKQTGDIILYRRQCAKCGHIEGTVQSTDMTGKGGVFTTSYGCYACNTEQVIEIKL